MKLKSVSTTATNSGIKTFEAPRLLIYSHDTFGLGHFRRCLKIAKAFKATYPESSILLVTGQPQAERYRMPEGIDFIKLPAVVKVGDNRYQPRSLGNSFAQIFELRRNLILEVARTFRPHIFLVDHAPIGMKGEIKKTLYELKGQANRPVLLLGLRDILDEPEKVCAAWESEGIYPILDEVYDRIFIYGAPEFFDPTSAYRFGQKARSKTSFTGFISDHSRAAGPTQEADRKTKRVLLTIGGGEDGAEIVSAYLEVLSNYKNRLAVETIIIFGPFMPDGQKEGFVEKAKGLPVRFEEFLPELAEHLQEADLVISMGGYNTVIEILSFAKKALIIPRIYPRKEQLLRAQRLSEMGLVRYISPEDLTPERLFETVASMLANADSPLAETRQKKLLPLDGATKLAELCQPLLVSQGVLK